MAALRPQARRTPAALPLTPQPKPGISLEEWEAKAPLDDLQLRSVEAVRIASQNIPLPAKFSTDEEGFPSGSRPSTPLARTKLALGINFARGGTPPPGSPTKRLTPIATHALAPSQPIATPEQFHDWFARVDRSVVHAQEAHFRAHLADVSAHLDTCDALVTRIDLVDAEVGTMLEEWKSVEDGGKNLKEACEKLLEERDKLIELTDDIGVRLEYFQELEHATRMLNHPGESLVLQGDFLYMVERVDICIDYLRAHRHYREAEVYLLRFQQCLTRAMTLIKMFFVGSLRALVADVTKRLSAPGISLTAQHHLLYTRFRSVSTQVGPLLQELERRAALHPDALAALLAECHQAYFSARRGMLVARLAEEIRGLDPARTEIVELTRAGCGYLKQLCTDEFNLYRTFFDSGEDLLYEYLETLCDYLYDDLRPRILHEQRLTALCEVCTVLQALMVLDAPGIASSTASPSIASSSQPTPSSSSQSEFETETGTDIMDDDSGTNRAASPEPGTGSRKAGLGRLHIARLLQMVLQDAQTRLFFKAQSVIQAEVRYFTPKPEDLAYPDKIADARKPPAAHAIREKEAVSDIFKLPSREKQDTWYPTLRKTIWVLSQLHDFVQPAIFEDIAQEALHLCRISLVAAADTIRAGGGDGDGAALNGTLFLVRHLFILKEMTQDVRLAQRDGAAADLGGGMTETLVSVMSKTSSLLPNALFVSLGMPRADESVSDAKLGIDQELKKGCEDTISICVDMVVRPLRDWSARVRVYSATPQTGLNKAPGKPTPIPALASHEWASQPVVEKLEANFRAACARELRNAAARVALYIEDARAVSVLLTHVRERAADEYASFAETARELHPGIASKLMSPPEVASMLQSVCDNEGQ